MPALSFQTAESQQDLQGILDLQLQNHLSTISAIDDGFVFVRHDLKVLSKMQAFAPQVICKDGDEVVAFTLAMTADCKGDVPELIPMFAVFDQIPFQGKESFRL